MTPLRRCASPRCPYGARYGIFRAFCKRHADELAAIRNSFISETRLPNGRHPISGTRGRARRLCLTVGCNEPAKAREAFCDVCLAMDDAGDEAA